MSTKELGTIGNAMMSCKDYESYVVKEECVEKGKYVIYAKKSRLIFNQPLPQYEITDNKTKQKMTKQLTMDDMSKITCKIDTALVLLCKEYEYVNNSYLNVFIIGNGADNAGVEPNASAFSNITHMYLNVLLAKDHDMLGFYSTICHELGHAFTSPCMLYSQEWGPGIGESFATFFEGYYIPGNPRYYACIESMMNNTYGYLNPYGKSGLMYNDFKNFRGYNPCVWIFLVSRYGLDSFKQLLKSGILKQQMTSKSLFQIIANHLKVDIKDLAAMWLEDLMTTRFHRKDPIRLEFAQKFLANKKCYDKNLTWKQESSFASDVNIYRGDNKVEAFGTTYIDLFDKIKVGGKGVTITLDGDGWVMCVVQGPDKTITAKSNTITITEIPTQRPFMLGITHTNFTNAKLNDTTGTATEVRINIQSMFRP